MRRRLLIAQHGRHNNFDVCDCQNWRERLDGVRGAARLSQLAIDCLTMMIRGLWLRRLIRAAVMRRRGRHGLFVRTGLRRPRARGRAERERNDEQNCKPKTAHVYGN